MNKKKLTALVAQKTGKPKIYVEEILYSTFESMAEMLSKGQKITINSFGTFHVKNMPKKNSRNPSIGEAIIIEAKDIVKFKPSPLLLKKKK